jgi:hypothetical protein
MSQELGKIEKPEANDYKSKRKIFLIPLIYSGDQKNKDYSAMFETYWKQVKEHIENLESRIGKAKHIYHESISDAGEEGLKVMEKLNIKTYEISRDKCKEEAILEALEDKKIFEENIDWQRCLLIGLLSETVANKISDSFLECSKRRYDYIGKKIDETLKQDEAAILFINERNLVQFPADIEVFRVSPPALNDIYKWVREQSSAQNIEKKEDSKDKEKSG